MTAPLIFILATLPTSGPAPVLLAALGLFLLGVALVVSGWRGRDEE